MPTPVYHFRLPPADRVNLEQIAKVAGKAPATFVRELVAVMCSGDFERINRFNADLMQRVTGQFTLGLETPGVAKSVAVKRRKRRRRARAT